MAAITIALAAKHLAMQLTQAYTVQYKALYNAVHQNSLFLNVWTLNTLLSPISGGHRHILLGIDNDQIDDDGKDVDIKMKQMTKMMTMVTSKQSIGVPPSLSLMTLAQVSPMGVDSHVCQCWS